MVGLKSLLLSKLSMADWPDLIPRVCVMIFYNKLQTFTFICLSECATG